MNDHDITTFRLENDVVQPLSQCPDCSYRGTQTQVNRHKRIHTRPTGDEARILACKKLVKRWYDEALVCPNADERKLVGKMAGELMELLSS